jgi:hypothetical protein
MASTRGIQLSGRLFGKYEFLLYLLFALERQQPAEGKVYND